MGPHRRLQKVALSARLVGPAATHRSAGCFLDERLTAADKEITANTNDINNLSGNVANMSLALATMASQVPMATSMVEDQD